MFLKRNVLLIAVLFMIASPVIKAQTKAVPDKNIERIVGTWKIQKILSGKTEVAKNPTSGQWIEFRTNGKYVNNATSLDSGSYRLNEIQSVLYLESQVSPGNDNNGEKKIVEWEIAFQDDTMTMQQTKKDKKDKAKKAHVDSMKYVYTRIADGSRMLNN